MPKYKHTTLKTIKYKDAPSGSINIGKWVPPFKKVKGGFGFVGVIAEDTKTGQLQCHHCGKWYQQLQTHMIKHKLNGESYRAKYGLLSSTALKSKRIRLIHSKTCRASIKAGKMNKGNIGGYGFKKRNIYAANRKGKKTGEEAKNRHGVCDLQIMSKIMKLSKKLGKTPSLIDIKKEYGQGIISIMHSRYGSYIKYCKNTLNLTPCYSSHNPRLKNDAQRRKDLIEQGKISYKKNKLWKKGTKLTMRALFGIRSKQGTYVTKLYSSSKDYKKKLLASIKRDKKKINK